MASKDSTFRHFSKRAGDPPGFAVIELLTALSIATILVALVFSAQQKAREAARRSSCQGNLKRIALALEEFNAAGGLSRYNLMTYDFESGTASSIFLGFLPPIGIDLSPSDCSVTAALPAPSPFQGLRWDGASGLAEVLPFIESGDARAVVGTPMGNWWFAYENSAVYWNTTDSTLNTFGPLLYEVIDAGGDGASEKLSMIGVQPTTGDQVNAFFTLDPITFEVTSHTWVGKNLENESHLAFFAGSGTPDFFAVTFPSTAQYGIGDAPNPPAGTTLEIRGTALDVIPTDIVLMSNPLTGNVTTVYAHSQGADSVAIQDVPAIEVISGESSFASSFNPNSVFDGRQVITVIAASATVSAPAPTNPNSIFIGDHTQRVLTNEPLINLTEFDGTHIHALGVSPGGSSPGEIVRFEVGDQSPALKIEPTTGVETEGSPVIVSGTVKTVRDGGLYTLTIDWGDGSPSETSTFDIVTGEAVRFDLNHSYADENVYAVTINTSGPGGVDGANTTLNIINAPPTVDVGPDQQVPGDKLTINAIFNDPGTLDTHTATIDWGDGTITTEPVSETPFGPPGDPAGLNGNVTWEHTYNSSGNYIVTVSVTDDDGGTGTGSLRAAIERLESDAIGPRVVTAPPLTVDVVEGESILTVEFSEAIDSATLSTNDVSVVNGDRSVPVVAIIELAPNSFDIVLDTSHVIGAALVSLGPDVTDLSGNAMDQNQDGINGQPNADVFRAPVAPIVVMDR